MDNEKSSIKSQISFDWYYYQQNSPEYIGMVNKKTFNNYYSKIINAIKKNNKYL